MSSAGASKAIEPTLDTYALILHSRRSPSFWSRLDLLMSFQSYRNNPFNEVGPPAFWVLCTLALSRPVLYSCRIDSTDFYTLKSLKQCFHYWNQQFFLTVSNTCCTSSTSSSNTYQLKPQHGPLFIFYLTLVCTFPSCHFRWLGPIHISLKQDCFSCTCKLFRRRSQF